MLSASYCRIITHQHQVIVAIRIVVGQVIQNGQQVALVIGPGIPSLMLSMKETTSIVWVLLNYLWKRPGIRNDVNACGD